MSLGKESYFRGTVAALCGVAAWSRGLRVIPAEAAA